ncbi:MAG: hypothetical protein H0U66_14470 [Gemmatimonadaceae bacterium]|nr:hypothetical protein [Gemmatimonadaceae bacterium]
MEDSPEDLPKPARQMAARPFFSPRPNSGEGVTGPLELGRRRAAQLFTPPSSASAAPVADRSPTIEEEGAKDLAELPASSAADGSTEIEDVLPTTVDADADFEKEPDFEGDWTPAPMLLPEQTLDAESLLASNSLVDDDQLVVEQFEHEDIELTAATPDMTDEHSIEVIAYDDANSLLKAAADHGATPEIDGLRLESTEFSFEQIEQPQRLNVDSFWASEPFSAADASAPAPAAPSVADNVESAMDAATAGESEHELAMELVGSEPSIEEQPFEWADDPSTTISHAQAALEPEPEHDPEPAHPSSVRIADIAPPWMSRLTPASTQALEELKESEPWDLTPAREVLEIPEERAALESAADAPVAAAGHDVADALERIAARVRDGGIDVPAGDDLSDEAALSAVLTALLRSRR